MGDRVIRAAGDVDQYAQLTCGESLTLRLDENPSTAYEWFFDLPQPTCMTLTGDTFDTANDSGIGCSGIRELRFTATAPGICVLRFRLSPPWDANDVGQRFQLTIDIS